MKNVLALLVAIVLPLSAAPLSGTKSIGPAGDYASITAAIAAVQTQTLSGPFVLELKPNYLSSVEAFPLVFSNLSTTAANSLTLRPQSGATGLSISSNDTTAATLDLNGVQFLTVDGRPGGVGTMKELTISNSNVSGVAVRFINESSGNAMRYLTLQGVNTSSSSGTIVFSTTTGANGNDNNIIDACDLRDGASTPANALYSLGSTGTTAQSNSANTVSNCNVFNFYAATAVDVAGVRLEGGNTGWSITGNSFYQTASRAAVAANARAIFINNNSGDNFTVTGNFIGGSAANAGGTAWTTTGTSAAYLFQGIRLNVGTATSSSAQGNTIQNIFWTTSSSATTQPGVWCGIHAQAGNVNIGTVTGNAIGSGTGTGSISVTTSGTGGTTFGISSASSGTVAVANNTIGSITTSGSATTVSASLAGIQVIGGANTISGNTIGSTATATANSLNAATSSTSSTGQQVTGILSTSNTSASITGNTVANLSNQYLGVSNSGQIRGIVTSAGINTITGNSVSKLSTTSPNPNINTSSAVLGISQSSTVAGQTVSQNVVHSLAHTSTSASANVIGIYYAGNTTTGPNLITRNLVHSLAIASTSPSSVLYGMYFNGGAFTAQNNMVRVGLDGGGNSTAGASQLSGIFDGSTSSRNYYHNSVYVGGSQTSGFQSTYALTSSIINSTRNFRNNIFVNARTNSGGSGRHYAVQYGGSAANPAGLTANNNLYFVNGVGGVLGVFASVDRTTLAAWRTATGVDSASLNADPLFINASGTATSVDLHAQNGSPAANGGSPIPAVSDDFDGEARNSFVPDIGADEFAPANEANLASLSLSGGATISPGVAANTLIYRSRVASTTSSITVTPSLTNPLAMVTVNGGSPATAVALNLGSNTISIVITAPDGTTKTYTLLVTNLAGTLSIGPTGDYLSITEVLADIRVKSLAGPLTLELQPSYANSVETFPLVFNNLSTTATNTLTLRLQSGAAGLSISSDYYVTVDLDGTRFVTIDGRPGGLGTAKELTIANTSTGGVAVRFVREASGNALRHLTFRGVNTNTPPFSGGGVIFFDGTDGPNGNDNNTLDSCDIGDGATTPAIGLYSRGSTGSTGQNNSGNTVSNCNFFNFYSTNNDAAGVQLGAGNTGWTINGNSFYQTSARTLSYSNVRPIYIAGSGDQFNIIGNFIGGSAPKAESLPWTTNGGSGSNVFEGIRLAINSGAVGSVQGNVIRNIVWNSSGQNIYFAPWTGIRIGLDPNQGYGSPDSCMITGNTIGAGNSTNSVIVNSTNGLGTAYGIRFESNALGTISDNSIGSIATNTSLSGIEASAPTITIANNIVGSTTTANCLNAVTAPAGTMQKVTGIVSYGNSAGITGNTVANLNNSYTGTSGAGQIIGIANYAETKTLTGNTVRNLSTTSQNAERGSSASVLGILAGSSFGSFSSNPTVSRNVVHSLSNSATSASVEVTGICCSGGLSSPSVIAGNMVHSLSIVSTSASSRLYGMNFDRGTFTVQNNMVRVGLDASGVSTAGASTVAGIFELGSFNELRNFHHNSVFVGGTQTAGGSTTSAYASNDFPSRRVFLNNFFVNARSNSGATSKHYAFKSNRISTLTADNNIYFVSGNGGLLGFYDIADCATLASLQVATRQNGSSAVVDPLFVNPTGDAGVVDLHLQPSNPAEGGGLPIAAVSDDFDGQPRSSLSPVDIGADAGNYISTGDIFPPAISYPLLSPVGLATNRVLSGWANIVDNSGTVASGATAPRLYFKKSTDADVFNVANDSSGNGWKYVTGNNGGSGSYSFTIDYTLISGGSVSEGNSIQYFVAAQDAANNLGSSPPAATASANPPVQNINAKPAAGVNSYSIAPTGGTVTVGPGGNFPNLTGSNGLFVALNAVPLSSNLIVKLTGDVTENGGTTLNANTANITIQPDSATMRTISGSGFNGLIRLSGANGVTLDGSFGGSGRYLTFRNTSTDGATITLVNDASNNTIRNCVLEGATTSTSSGVVFFSTGLTTGNDNNTVTGNHIRDRSDAVSVPANLIYSAGSSDTVANGNNVISNNELSNFLVRGLYVAAGSDSWNIIENTIYQTAPRTENIYGITFNGLGTNMIRGNTVRDLLSDSGTYGIQSYNGNTTVVDNRLWNLGNAAASNSVIAILIYPNAGQMVTAVNNMVALSSFGTTAQYLSGIQVGGQTGGTAFIAHNTVLISGSSSAQSATCAFESSGYSTATVKNNVFLNVRTGGGSHRAAAKSSTGLLTMDSNVYAGTGLDTVENFFFDASTGTPVNFAQWQALVPSDTHSTASNPGGNYTSTMFVDPANGNLHLVPIGNVLVNNTGAPLAGVTTDCDGDTRSPTNPDIGADELRPAFQQWAQANAVGDDPNSPGTNGLANLLNFAFGLNPASGSRNELNHTGNVITPGGITTQILSGTPTAKFIRRADYVAAGLTYTAQFSANLTSWETDNTTPTVLATDGVNEVAGLNYPLLSGGAQARFFRLVVGLQ